MPAAHQIADSPRELGLDPAKVEELFKRAEREVTEGLLPSCQIAIARNGRIATNAGGSDRSVEMSCIGGSALACCNMCHGKYATPLPSTRLTSNAPAPRARHAGTARTSTAAAAAASPQ